MKLIAILGERLSEKNEVSTEDGGEGRFFSFDLICVGPSGRTLTTSESMHLPGIHKCPVVV